MGLDIYLYRYENFEDTTRREEAYSEEQDSAKHPKHLFKIGYFRSSYNEGGIHHKLEQAGAPSLDQICGYDGEYKFQPDWKMMGIRAQQAIDKLAELDELTGGVSITSVSPNMFQEPPKVDEAEAMRIYLEAQSRKNKDSFFEGAYSNSHGVFFGKKPIEVVAAIPGITSWKTPCVYLVYKQEGGSKWYRDALEIVQETCDYVLSQPDPEKYWLHWSG